MWYRISFPNLKSQGFSVVYSGSVIVLDFAHKSNTHFDLIFVNDIFFVLSIIVQMFQHPMLKRPPSTELLLSFC